MTASLSLSNTTGTLRNLIFTRVSLSMSLRRRLTTLRRRSCGAKVETVSQCYHGMERIPEASLIDVLTVPIATGPCTAFIWSKVMTGRNGSDLGTEWFVNDKMYPVRTFTGEGRAKVMAPKLGAPCGSGSNVLFGVSWRSNLWSTLEARGGVRKRVSMMVTLRSRSGGIVERKDWDEPPTFYFVNTEAEGEREREAKTPIWINGYHIQSVSPHNPGQLGFRARVLFDCDLNCLSLFQPTLLRSSSWV